MQCLDLRHQRKNLDSVLFNADKAVVECYEEGTTREIVKAHRANGYEYEAMAVDACIREGKTECAVPYLEGYTGYVGIDGQDEKRVGCEV